MKTRDMLLLAGAAIAGYYVYKKIQGVESAIANNPISQGINAIEQAGAAVNQAVQNAQQQVNAAAAVPTGLPTALANIPGIGLNFAAGLQSLVGGVATQVGQNVAAQYNGSAAFQQIAQYAMQVMPGQQQAQAAAIAQASGGTVSSGGGTVRAVDVQTGRTVYVSPSVAAMGGYRVA